MNEILYLEMTEIIPETPLDQTGTFLRLPVVDKAAALALRDQMAATWFQGKQHKDQLHHHIPMGSCTSEPLP